MLNKINIAIGLAIIAILIGVIGLVGGNSTAKLGGTTNYDALDVTDGYYISGTKVIDSSRTLTGTKATITGTATSSLILSTVKGCIQIVTTSGSTSALVITGTSSPAVSVTAGTCF